MNFIRLVRLAATLSHVARLKAARRQAGSPPRLGLSINRFISFLFGFVRHGPVPPTMIPSGRRRKYGLGENCRIIKIETL